MSSYEQRIASLEEMVAQLAHVTEPDLIYLRQKLEAKLDDKRGKSVYIIQLGDDLVKIGQSMRVERRIENHESDTKLKAKTLVVIPGDEVTETILCNYFEEYRIRGREWFTAKPIVDFLYEMEPLEQCLVEFVDAMGEMRSAQNYLYEWLESIARGMPSATRHLRYQMTERVYDEIFRHNGD